MSYIRASKTVTSEAARSTVHVGKVASETTRSTAHASKTVASEATKSTVHVGKTVARETTRSTAHGSSKASNVCEEGSSMASCCFSTKRFTSEHIAFTQVKRKLNENLEDDELFEKVNKLIHVETILSKFDHLVEGKLKTVREAVREDKKEDLENVQEVRAAKEREKSRYVQVAIIPLKISISVLARPVPPLLRSIGNFLCTDYGTNHVGLMVGDVFLEWGDQSLVTPKVKDCKELYPGGEVLDITKDCPHNIAADQKAPHDSLQLKTVTEETDILSERTMDKKPIFKELAKVISKYNSKFYYHPISRNCQGFVRDALKALGIDNKPETPQPNPQLQELPSKKSKDIPSSFTRHEDLDAYMMKQKNIPATPQPNPRLQELQSKKSKGIPSSFARHEDLDFYMMKQKQDWFEKLDTHSFEFLKLSYSLFHGDTACDRPICQAHLFDVRVANKPPTPEPNPQLLSKKSKGVPSSFARHEDLDAYVVEQKQDNFKKLDADNFESLQLSYLFFHGNNKCHWPTCQAHLLADVLGVT